MLTEFYGELYIQKYNKEEYNNKSDESVLTEKVDTEKINKQEKTDNVDTSTKRKEFRAYSINHSNVINAPPKAEAVIA